MAGNKTNLSLCRNLAYKSERTTLVASATESLEGQSEHQRARAAVISMLAQVNTLPGSHIQTTIGYGYGDRAPQQT